jgi:hypothetical protein
MARHHPSLFYPRRRQAAVRHAPFFEENNLIDIYDVDEGRVNVMYVMRKCQQGLPSNWGNWNVPVGTVVEITIHLKNPITIADLKIPDIEKLKWYTDDSMTTYYQDNKEGVEYSVRAEMVNSVVEQMVNSITYGPTEKDKHLLCNKKAPKIRC